jgi:hypothetical protein
VFFLCVQRQLIWDTQRTPHSHRDLWRPNQGPRLSILLGTTPLVDTLITFWTLDILFEELDFGCHPTSNSQHICNHNFYLLNLQQPRLCTHLEDTHPPLFPEFQLMKPIFWSSALITVHHHSKSQSTSTSTIQYTHSTNKMNPLSKHTLMPLPAHTCQGVTCPIWIPGLAVFSGRIPRTPTAADTEQSQPCGYYS